MNYNDYEQRAASRIVKVRLDLLGETYIRPLSALDKTKMADRYQEFKKAEELPSKNERLMESFQLFIISRGLVNDEGRPVYDESQVEVIGEHFLSEEIDELFHCIAEHSKLNTTVDDAEKNLNPTPSEDSNSDSQPSSDGGTPISS
jgi:hypothetical protein